MNFYRNLYVGNTVKKPEKIKRKLKRYAKLPNIYVIAYMQGNNRLEIYHSLMLQQWYYKENPPCIIGIASSQEEAVEIIRQIAEEALIKTGQADLISYLFGEAKAPQTIKQ